MGAAGGGRVLPVHARLPIGAVLAPSDGRRTGSLETSGMAIQIAAFRAFRPYRVYTSSRSDRRPRPDASRWLSPEPTCRAYPDDSCSSVLSVSATARSRTNGGTERV